jgi:hypothetical protein
VLDIQMRRPKDQRSASGDPLPWAGPWVGTKPDGDKLTRAILDCGTGLIWTDDSLIARGVMPDPDSREPWFLSAAHSEADVAETLNAFEDAINEVLVEHVPA